MDVSAVSGPANSGGPGSAAPVHAQHDVAVRASSDGAPVYSGVIDAAAVVASIASSSPRIVPEGGYAKPIQIPAERESTAVKFDLASADVLARFWIDEHSNRVIITMYDRNTGEVIRQTPPRAVLDTVAVLEGCGLAVDHST